VSAEVEAARVVPVVAGIRAAEAAAASSAAAAAAAAPAAACRRRIPISVDTFHASVARAAVAAGADLVNDVSGGLADAGMLAAAAELQVRVCV
jgi:dihydropteroate synthase